MSSGVSRERIRLLYLIPDLRGGGAELALIHFLEHHDPDAFELHLAVCRPTGAYMARLPARVTLHTLGKTGRWGVPALCWRLRGLVRRLRPDALISYLWYADGLQLLTRRFFGRRGSWPRSICSIVRISSMYTIQGVSNR